MTTPLWQFEHRRARQADQSYDSNKDLFEGSAEDPTELAVSLAREVIQNSLDARLNHHDPVTVRFTFPSLTLTKNRTKIWTNGLKKHLDRIDTSTASVKVLPEVSEFIEANKVEDRMNYLLVEDFGTSGLKGEFEKPADHLAPSGQNWHYFFVALGKTNKDEGNQGSFGLGKTVFHAASKAHSFIALTQRSEDKKELLMGKTILYSHSLENGKSSVPEGYFAMPVDEDDDESPWMPVQSEERLEDFRKDFGITRARQDEPGTSFVILWPKLEPEADDQDVITFNKLLRAAVHSFIYPIARQKLKIELVEGDRIVSVDESSLSSVIESEIEFDESDREVNKDLLLSFRDMVDEQWTVNPNKRILLQLPYDQLGKAPTSRRKLFSSMLDDHLKNIRERLQDGTPKSDIVVIRVPVEMWDEKNHTQNEWELSHFDVVLMKDARATQGADYFVRDYLTISGMDVMRTKGYMAFVHVASGAWKDGSDPAGSPMLAEMLRLSERPAHTKWFPKGDHAKRYKHSESRIRFVINAATDIVDLIEAEERDAGAWKNALLSLFGVASSDGIPTSTRRARRKGKKPIRSRPNNWVVERHGDTPGLVVRYSPNEKSTIPRAINIEVFTRRETSSGTPRYHSPLDYDFTGEHGSADQFDMTAKGCTYAVVGPNSIRLSELSEGFSFHLTGLDDRWEYSIPTVGEWNAEEEENG